MLSRRTGWNIGLLTFNQGGTGSRPAWPTLDLRVKSVMDKEEAKVLIILASFISRLALCFTQTDVLFNKQETL